jgi:HPt (histidine-containing phosphotransfer) domain-containing protein
MEFQSAAEERGSTAGPSIERVIDLVHLSRMTLGDRALEREVLALFSRQARLALARIKHGPPEAVAAAAHTLKGAARGIGAHRVARAAEVVEHSGHPDRADAVRALEGAVAEAGAVIEELLSPIDRMRSAIRRPEQP